MNEKKIYEETCSFLKKVLDKNDISNSRYQFALNKTETYNFKFSHFYNFQGNKEENTVPGGGNQHSQDCTKIDFINLKEKYLKYTETAPERDSYLKSKINKPVNALADEHFNIVWKSPTISYRYTCTNCDGLGIETCYVCYGKGKQTCYNCNGSRRSSCSSCGGSGSQYSSQSYTDSNGVTQTTSSYKSCSACGGMGTQSCFTCNGSGVIQCSTCHGTGKTTCRTCSGHGFFRDYCTIYLKAYKRNKFAYPKNKLHVQRISDKILNANNAYFAKHFSPKLISHQSISKNEYVLEYTGEATVVETSITIDNKQKYFEAAVNDIGVILQPKIFDYLLSPLVDFYKNQEKGILGFIKNKTPLKGFFQYENYQKFKENPTIARAFKSYSSADDEGMEDRKYTIKGSIILFTEYMISDNTSETIANLTLKTINAVSPFTTSIIWWLTYLLVIVSESYTTLNIFKNFLFRDPNLDNLLFVVIAFGYVYLLIAYFITFAFIAPIASLLNKIVTKARQLKAEKVHRTKVNNRQHLKTLFKINFFTYVVIVMTMYLYNFFGKLSFTHEKIEELGIKSYLSINKHPSFLDIMVGKQNSGMVDKFLSNFNTFTVKSVYNMTIWFNQIGIHVTRAQMSIITVTVIVLVPFLYFYFLPSIIAFKMKNENRKNILIKNIFLVPFLLFTPWLYLLYSALN